MMPIITPDQGERSADKKVSSIICITTVNGLWRIAVMKLLKYCQEDKKISAVCKNYDGLMNQLG